MVGAGVEVRLLGSFEVLCGGRVAEVPRGRSRVVVAALALSAGQVVGVEELAGRLWGVGGMPVRARSSLHNAVRGVRGLLGAGAVRTVGGGYVLDLDPDRVDALRFLRLVAAARAESDVAAAYELLTEGLRLWRGDVLVGVDSESLRRDVGASLVEHFLAAVEWRVDLDVAAGRLGGLVAELRELTSRFPLRESLWVRLLTVLFELGRHAEALEAYHAVRVRLAEALGTDPSVELQRMYRRVLTADSSDSSGHDPGVGPGGVSGVVEGDGGGGADGEGDVAGGGVVLPRQLPPDVPDFVGREEELARLDGLLEGGGSELTIGVVHGVGGVGKTALAVHWAHRVASRFPDGQLYVNLQGYGPQAALSAEAALGALLRSLGLPERAVPVGVGERAALLRSRLAGRRVLVLLDNAREAEQVRPLLPGGDSVVLVTSRSQMRGLGVRDGARRMALREMGECEAARLISRTVADRRVISDGERAALLGLCGRLPLALRIAAELTVRYAGGSLAELVDDMRAARLEALADPDDPAADPRAVFSWSYQTLTVQDARVFRQLGLHPGSEIGLFAAAALVGRPVAAARRLLDRLVAVHLLEEHHQGRYHFHDLVREYAVERGAEEDAARDRDGVLRRVLGWYLQTADTASRTVIPGRHLRPLEVRLAINPGLTFSDAAEALRWYDAERASLVAAVQRAAEIGADDIAWRLTDAMSACFLIRPSWDDWKLVYQTGLACAQRLNDPVAQGAMLTGLGNLCSFAANDEEALGYYRWGLKLFRNADAKPQQASALSLIAACHMQLGETDTALRLFAESIAIAQQTGERAREAHALSNLSIVYLNLARAHDALETSVRACELRRELGDRRGLAHSLDNMGDAYVELGDHAKAVDCYTESLSIVREIHDRRGEGIYLANLARAQSLAGDTDTARRNAAEAWSWLVQFPDTEPERVRTRLLKTFPELADATEHRHAPGADG